MRLHNVKLKNYRGVDDCTVEFPVQGITVVEGDNEVGKTSILEAVNLILTELDSSGKKAVKAVRPVHVDEGPEVQVEISSGAYRFTYSKRWHRRPQTTLEVTAPRREQHTGREAHERVEAILAETLDQDLWKALTIEQSAEPGLPKLGIPSLGQALDLAAGSNLAASGDDDLWERICEERLRYWTGTGRESQERRRLSGRVSDASAKQNEIKDRLQAVENDIAEADRLAREEVSLISRQDEAGRAESEFSQQWNATESLRSLVERLEADHSTAQAQQKKTAQDRDYRKELIGEVNTRREGLTAIQAEVEQAAPELALAVEHSQETDSALSVARSELSVAEDELRLANSDRDYYRNLIEQEQLSERYERVIRAQEDLKEAEDVMDSALVSDELVSKIEQANIDVASAKAALSGSATSVETTALSAVSAQINGAGVELATGEAHETDVTGSWELVVPNIVQVRMQTGSGSSDLAAALHAAQEEHNRLCAQGSVANLVEARQKAEERREAERRQAGAQKTIIQDVRDLTPEVIAQKVDGLAKRTAAYPSNRPESPPLPSSFEDAKQVASHAQKSVIECRAEVDRCQVNSTGAGEARRQAEISAAVTDERLDNARIALEQAEQKLEADRQKQSDSALDENLAVEQKKVEEAADALKQVQKKLQAQDPDTIKAKLENAQDVKTRTESDLRDNRERRIRLRATLEARGEAGLHSQLNEATSAYKRLVREQERTEARAQAALLLHQVFEKRRLEARQRYIAPFKEQIERLGRIVFGPTFEVELDGDLRVAQRTVGGVTLDVEQLSVGALEQIGVVTRLACAAIVSPDGGGAPVVIDDALGWSDPTRLQAMGAAIAAAGRDCQVIVLTCTPGRYGHVGNATVVRLPR